MLRIFKLESQKEYKKSFFYLILIYYMTMYTLNSEAAIFSIEVTDYGGIDNFPILKAALDREFKKIEDDVNSGLPDEGPDRLMQGISNASLLASKGIGKDYASYMEMYLIGVGAGIGIDQQYDSTIDSEISGGGAALGVVVGTTARNLGIESFAGLDAKRLNIYANFMRYKHNQIIQSDPESESKLAADLFNLGVHFRYNWIDGIGGTLLGWGGVKLHWGYDYNQTKIFFENDLDKNINLIDLPSNNGDTATIAGKITGSPRYQVKSQTHSIPLEISTDVRFIYFMSLYGGLGTDINYGKAEGRGLLNGNVSPLACTTGDACVGITDLKVQVQANLDAEGRVDPLMLRGFTGLQLNLPYIRIYAQIDKAFGTELIAISSGLKIVY
jgi:hypothetical protein